MSEVLHFIMLVLTFSPLPRFSSSPIPEKKNSCDSYFQVVVCDDIAWRSVFANVFRISNVTKRKKKKWEGTLHLDLPRRTPGSGYPGLESRHPSPFPIHIQAWLVVIARRNFVDITIHQRLGNCYDELFIYIQKYLSKYKISKCLKNHCSCKDNSEMCLLKVAKLVPDLPCVSFERFK